MNDSFPYLSIIVPSYNEEKVISKTIDSLLSQNYFLFELLIIDDGSNDLTDYELFKRYDFKPSSLENHKDVLKHSRAYKMWDCCF